MVTNVYATSQPNLLPHMYVFVGIVVRLRYIISIESNPSSGRIGGTDRWYRRRDMWYSELLYAGAGIDRIA